MRRRELVTLIGAAAVAPARIARAQQAQLPVIGFLHSGSPGPFAKVVAAFREGLREAGYVPGQNVRIDFRWAEGNYELLPELALDLVRRDVSVIVAGGGSPAVAGSSAAAGRSRSWPDGRTSRGRAASRSSAAASRTSGAAC